MARVANLIGFDVAKTDWVATNASIGPGDTHRIQYSPGQGLNNGNGFDGYSTPNTVTAVVSFKDQLTQAQIQTYIASLPASRPLILIWHHEPENGDFTTGAGFTVPFITQANRIRAAASAAGKSAQVRIAMCSSSSPYRIATDPEVTSGNYVRGVGNVVDMFTIDIYQGSGGASGPTWPSNGLANYGNLQNWLPLVNNPSIVGTVRPLGFTEYGVDDPVGNAARMARFQLDHDYIKRAFNGGSASAFPCQMWCTWYQDIDQNTAMFTDAPTIALWQSFENETSATIIQATASIGGGGSASCNPTRPSSGSGIAFVQAVAAAPVQQGAPLVLTVTATTTTAGNTVIVGARSLSNRTLTSVADSRGNAWNVDLNNAAGAASIAIASCVVATGKVLVSGDTITLTYSSATGVTYSASAAEFSGELVTAGGTTPDQTGVASAIATSVTAVTTVGTVGAGELVFSAAAQNTATGGTFSLTATDANSGGTWHNLALPAAPAQLDLAWQLGGAAGQTYSAAWTVAGASNTAASIVTYQAAPVIPQGTAGSAAGAGSASASATIIFPSGGAAITWSKLIQPTGGGTMNVCAVAPDGRIVGGSDTQGYYLSNDHANHWQVINAGVGPGSAWDCCASVAWSITEPNTIYSACGDQGAGGGFLVSTNGGATWSLRTSAVQFAGNHGASPLPDSDPRSTGDLIAQDGTFVYVGTVAKGIARSSAATTAGSDGFPVTATMGGVAPGTNSYYCRALIYDAANVALWAALFDAGTGHGGLWKCTSPHAATPNFVKITGAPTSVEDVKVVGGFVYCACDHDGLWQFSIAGGTWRNLNGATVDTTTTFWDSIDALPLGTTHAVVASASEGVPVSGTTINFMRLDIATSGTGTITYSPIAVANVNTSVLQPDGQALLPFNTSLMLGHSGFKNGNVVFDPNDGTGQTVLLPGSSSFYKSTDGGVHWGIFSRGDAAFHGQSVAVDPLHPNHIAFGATDWGSFDISDGVGFDTSTAVNVPFGTTQAIRCVTFDPLDSTVYGGWSTKSSQTSGGEVTSRAWNDTSGWAVLGSPALSSLSGGLPVTGLLAIRDPDGSGTKVVIAVVESQGIWRYTVAGGWVQVSTAAFTGSQTPLTYLDYAGNGVCYAFDRSQGVFRSSNFGVTWSLVFAANGGASFSSGALSCNPAVAGEVWITTSTALVRLSSANTTPVAHTISASQVATSAASVVVSSGGTVYVSTDDTGSGQGIFSSIDSGVTWTDLDPPGIFAGQSTHPYQLAVDDHTGWLFSGAENIISTGAPTPTSAVGWVQNVGSGTGISGTVTVTLGTAMGTTVGNTLILAGRSTGGFTISSVSDSRGNAWSVDASGSGTQAVASIASAFQSIALVPGDSITVTFSGVTGTQYVTVEEYAGVAPPPQAADQTGSAAATGVAVTATTALASAQATELVITACAASTATTFTLAAVDADSGGTWAYLNFPAGSWGVGTGWQVASASSLFSAAWTAGAGTNVSATIVTYETGSGLSGPAPQASLAGAGAVTAAATVFNPSTPPAGVLGVGVAIAAATVSGAQTAFVQNLTSGSSTTSIVIMTVAAPGSTAGNTLILAGRSAGGLPLLTVTDSKGNAWTIDEPSGGTKATVALASALMASPLVAGDTITATFTGPAVGTVYTSCAEFSGLWAGGDAADVKAAALSATTAVTVATATAGVQAVELAISACAASNAATFTLTTPDPDSGGTWNLLALPLGSWGVGIGYQNARAQSQFSAAWTASAGTNTAAVLVTYVTSPPGFVPVTANLAGTGTASTSAQSIVLVTAAIAGGGTAGAVPALAASASLAGRGVCQGTSVILGGIVAFVQNVGSAPSATGVTGTLTVSAALPTSVGNMISLWARSVSGSAISSVTDSRGNTWSVDVASVGGATSTTGLASTMIAAGKALVSGDIITVTFTKTANHEMGCAEFSGVQAAGAGVAVDQIANVHLATSGAITVTTSATSRSGDLAICTIGGSSSTATYTLTTADPSSGGTWHDLNLPGVASTAAWQPLTVTSLLSCTWTPSTSSNTDASIVTYLQAATVVPVQVFAALAGAGTAGSGVQLIQLSGWVASGGGTVSVFARVFTPGTGAALGGTGAESAQPAIGAGAATAGTGAAQATALIINDSGGSLVAGAGQAGSDVQLTTLPAAALAGAGTISCTATSTTTVFTAAALTGSGAVSALATVVTPAALAAAGTVTLAPVAAARPLALAGAGTTRAIASAVPSPVAGRGAVVAFAATVRGASAAGAGAATATATVSPGLWSVTALVPGAGSAQAALSLRVAVRLSAAGLASVFYPVTPTALLAGAGHAIVLQPLGQDTNFGVGGLHSLTVVVSTTTVSRASKNAGACQVTAGAGITVSRASKNAGATVSAGATVGGMASVLNAAGPAVDRGN